jgi:hypothetical protein
MSGLEPGAAGLSYKGRQDGGNGLVRNPEPNQTSTY